MITVHGFSPSGNCHKVRMVLEQLGREYHWNEVESSAGATRIDAYLAMNPNGKVPIIELDDGRVLTESNAIAWYLSQRTALWPDDAWQQAQALSWMFFEQYSHEPYIAVARYISGWTPLDSPSRAELPRLRARGRQALAVMEGHLQARPWFSGAAYGVADIALFAYTDVVPHGGIALTPYPAIRGWLDRVRLTPRFVALPQPDAQAASRIAQST